MNDMTTPGIGHNITSREQQIRDNILERHGHLVPRKDELLETAAKIPTEITEEMAGKVTDFIKSISAHLKALEGARQAEKEEFLQGSRIVDGIFKTMSDPLKETKAEIEKRLGKVIAAKEARLRAEAAEKARLEREAAEERRRVAEAQAAREREAAAEARRRAEEAERQQREAREARLREEAERERKRAEEQARIDAEIAAANERRRAAEAAEEESKRTRARAIKQAEEAEAAALKRRKEAEAAAEDERKAAERRAREEEREINRRRAEAEREAKAAERVAGRAERELEAAEKKEATAEVKERKVENASPAEFGRTRGEYGGLATQQQIWTHANLDRATLDLGALRPYFTDDALAAAVGQFIAAGGRKLTGVDIYQDARTRVI